MQNHNHYKNNNLESQAAISTPINNWLKVTNITEIGHHKDKISSICRKYQQQKRWILCVNGNDQQMRQLAKQVDKSKLLRVNGQKSDVSFEQIKEVLIKGNCSTVVLYQSAYNQQQLLTLQQCAQLGNTQCVVINCHANTLH